MEDKTNNKTIVDFLNEYIPQTAGRTDGLRLISFHMPGHKGRTQLLDKAGYADFIRNITACDITEIPGADALFCPETTLRAVMDNYARLYGVRHTELLVNGSSAGVMASIIAAVPVGGKLVLGRSSHHSAFSALRLGGINPVYIRSDIDAGTGLAGGISPAALRAVLSEHPDADAVLVTSPNYYGMLSDIASLAHIAHEYGALLIVDQAHGAHLKFFDDDAFHLRESGGYVPFPQHAAESLGADIVIDSTHKTLLSFTGSGILNICSDRVSIPAVSDALRMLQTTSPSYILMGSLDVNERIMREYGSEIIAEWRDDLIRFYRRASRISGLEIAGSRYIEEMTHSSESSGTGNAFPLYHHRSGLDLTKINISMAALGLDGARLDRELRHQGILSEMVHGEYVMLMTGAGNVTEDYNRLLAALKDISENYGVARTSVLRPRPALEFSLETAGFVPFEAQSVPLYQADGRVLYDPVIIYPPGTPAACPGEIMNMDVISYISDAITRGEKVTGVDDEGMVRVGAEPDA